MRITKVVYTKPPTPEQARIKAMQAQVRQAQQRVKAERLRQQQTRLNHRHVLPSLQVCDWFGVNMGQIRIVCGTCMVNLQIMHVRLRHYVKILLSTAAKKKPTVLPQWVEIPLN